MFAEQAHAGQAYDKYPYTYHLGLVVQVLEKFGWDDPVMLCGGWLHDCIEDTNTSYNDVKAEFGEEVAELVYAVTNELGRNRKERNERTYPKIRGNQRATALKLADRIANVEHGAINGGKDDMYRKEFSDFESNLRLMDAIPEDSRLERQWRHLARLLNVSLNLNLKEGV
jgi:guanosine-3',5'-bis(diphosphate) 3'-pyrophosphohydrolase